jgi:hypothetical protein
MKEEKEYYLLGEQGFWNKFFSKLLFTLISVKVWGLIAATAVSTWLLIIHNTSNPYEVGGEVFERGINGAQWVTFNTTIWALIFGMKEISEFLKSAIEPKKKPLHSKPNQRKYWLLLHLTR